MNTKETRYCENCGVVEDDLIDTADGHTYCRHCLDELDYAECDDCGEWVPGDTLTTVSDGDCVCETCRDDSYCYCEDCGAYVDEDDIVCINPNTRCEFYVCRDCADRRYYRCCDCGDYFDRDHVAGELNGEPLCESCYEGGYYTTCNDCGDILNEDCAYYDDNGYAYCESCYYDHDHSDSPVHDYGYKPHPEFHKRSSEHDDPLYMGVELEIADGNGKRNDCGWALLDAVNAGRNDEDHIYLKHDGSLDEDGIEIVTHPCSLAYHLYEMRWAELCRIATKDYGYKSHDAGCSCGLHVHIGREQLGEDEAERNANIAKIILLVYRHWDALTAFSRRKAHDLDHWAERPNLKRDYLGENSISVSDVMYANDDTRYHAVNLQNSRTIEFRLYRGSLKRDTIAATLQLTHNICTYAMSHSVAECVSSQFSDLVNEHEFRELTDYCKAHKLTTDELSELAPTATGSIAETPSPAPVDETYDASRDNESHSVTNNLAIGDLVRVRTDSLHYHVCPAAFGDVSGVIVANNHGLLCVAFDVPDLTDASLPGHNCSVAFFPGNYRNCWWLNARDLVRVDPYLVPGTNIAAGDTVITYRNIDDCNLPVGAVGRVARISDANVELPVGVDFAESADSFGHYLHSLCDCLPDDTGWWVNPQNIIRCVERDGTTADEAVSFFNHLHGLSSVLAAEPLEDVSIPA